MAGIPTNVYPLETITASKPLLRVYGARALFLLKNGDDFVEVTHGDFPLEGLG